MKFRRWRAASRVVASFALLGATLVAVSNSEAEAATQTLLDWGSTWRYRDTGVDPGTDWVRGFYDDSTWRSGRGQLGYGEGDEATTVGFGGNVNNRYITTWFRTRFEVTDARAFSSLQLDLIRDDGARVYINGMEAARNNLPTGDITSTTRANASVDGAAENVPISFTLPSWYLKTGWNTVAVEVHQRWVDSWDLSFDLRLRASAPDATTAYMVAAGDVALCGNYWPPQVAQVVAASPGTFAMLGDGAYPDASLTNYRNCYDPYFGQVLNRTKPVIGNHEYRQPQASGYFGYFGTSGGSYLHSWYSYELGNWHVVALDSECALIGGCGVGSPQYQWLQSDLAASTTSCLAVMWHRPRWSSSTEGGSNASTAPLYDLAWREGADILLSGHSHNYERFTRLAPNGTASSTGIRQFVVGTGGAPLYPFGTPVAGSVVRNSNTWGALRLTLRSDGYDWRFVPVADRTFTDSGSDTC